jgi:hypothetical protein
MIWMRHQSYLEAHVLQDVHSVINYTFDWALHHLQPIAARHFSLPDAFPRAFLQKLSLPQAEGGALGRNHLQLPAVWRRP